MQRKSLNNITTMLRLCLLLIIVSGASLFFFSFTVNKINADFLKELGISKTDADQKISSSFLAGYLDTYGARNAKNIALGNRTAVTNDLLTYTKQYVNSAAFKKEYTSLKETNKPAENKIQTPEEMRKVSIEMHRKSVAQTEAIYKKADAGTKPIFETALTEAKKQLKIAEDPGNKAIAGYTKNYPELVKINQQSYELELKRWEDKYPANQLLFVKQRLLQFLNETKDIDFGAELTLKNGKKVFVNPAYESKSRNWKKAFRAGKEVVEPARAFVQQWLEEMK